jgi:hypothetical protein
VKVVKVVKLNEPIIKGVKNNPGMVSLWKKSHFIYHLLY